MPFGCTIPRWVIAMFIVISGFTVRTASATTTLNFRDTLAGPGFALDGVATGTATVDNVTVTMTLFPDGVFNQTGSAFGINAVSGADDSDEFDAGEGFTFFFNHNIILNSVSVSAFGSTESGRISYDGGSVISSITSTGTTLLNSSVITSGTILRFESVVGAFSLDSLAVTTIPEPSAYACLAGSATLGLATIQRRRTSRVKSAAKPASST